MTAKIIVRYAPPPIPQRAFDWSAIEDGWEPGLPIGYGHSAAEAVTDLQEQIEDRQP